MWRKITSSPLSKRSWSLLITLFGITGIVMIAYSTVWGAVLSDDSYHYISSARNLLAGKGFSLTPHFPPVLPLLLSLIGLFRVDPLISIRWLNAVLFALNIYLVARIVYTLTRSRVFSIIGGLFCLVSSTLIMVHSNAMSEALFISFMLSGMLIFAINYKKEGILAPLLIGIFFGLAAGTRYIGISFLFVWGMFWLVEKGRKFGTRVRNAAIFSLAGITPLFLWAIRNELLIGRPTAKEFAVHLISARLWVDLANTILLWFIPGRLVNGKELYWIAGIVFLLVIGLIYIFWQTRKRAQLAGYFTDVDIPISLILWSIPAYLFILVISISFFDYHIPIDERLLSPVQVIGWILILWILARQWKTHRRLEMSIVAVLILAILGTNLIRSFQMVQSYHADGRGYASSRDHISETYAYLRNRPDIPIYSNAYPAIYFWTGRVTYPIPSSAGLPAMKADMEKTGALLVIFDSIRVELYGTTRDELTQGLVEQIHLSEATIYRSP